VSIVLSVFMGGLALGSWSAGGFARRFESRTPALPLRLYALAELVIGFSGLLVPGVLIWGRELLIKIGSGVSWGIDTTAVELVPSVPALFGHYHPNAAELLTSPLARVVIDDGRRFLEQSTDQYDVITIDPPPPPEAAGSSLLYSKEFYASAKKRLRPDGIVQQWYRTRSRPSWPPWPGRSVSRFPTSAPFCIRGP